MKAGRHSLVITRVKKQSTTTTKLSSPENILRNPAQIKDHEKITKKLPNQIRDSNKRCRSELYSKKFSPKNKAPNMNIENKVDPLNSLFLSSDDNTPTIDSELINKLFLKCCQNQVKQCKNLSFACKCKLKYFKCKCEWRLIKHHLSKHQCEKCKTTAVQCSTCKTYNLKIDNELIECDTYATRFDSHV